MLLKMTFLYRTYVYLMGIADIPIWYFKKHTSQPAMSEGYVEMTYPDIPNHPKQKYCLTTKGLELSDSLKHKK